MKPDVRHVHCKLQELSSIFITESTHNLHILEFVCTKTHIEQLCFVLFFLCCVSLLHNLIQDLKCNKILYNCWAEFKSLFYHNSYDLLFIKPPLIHIYPPLSKILQYDKVAISIINYDTIKKNIVIL